MERELISHKLAEFAVNTRFWDIPAPIVVKARQHILDTFGAGIAGGMSDEIFKLARVFATAEGVGTCPLWATGRFASPRNAALANGMACRAFGLDDTGGCAHSGAVVIPAAVAVLPLCRRPVPGTKFITAIVLGYDIARRALDACGDYEAHNGAGWHSTSTCGTFGAAAACGCLLGLDVPAMQSALGFAASTSSGLWAFIHDGAQSRSFQAGRAAEGGLLAALLAHENIQGPGLILEEGWGGFGKTFAPITADPDAWARELGTDWKLGHASIKPYASFRGTHGAVDALGILMDEAGCRESDIARIEVRLSAFLNDRCGGYDVASLPAAQMSLPYALAARLVYNDAGLRSYAAERRTDDRIRTALQRIALIVDVAQQPHEEPLLTITTRDERVLTKRVSNPLGTPGNPVGEEDIVAKFRNIAALVWPAVTIDVLQHLTRTLDSLTDMSEVTAVLAMPPLTTEVFS